jgi:hypothetical protein
MRYKRVDKLFLRLWVVVMLIGLYNLHDFCQNKIWPKRVFSHHIVGVTLPMLSLVTSKDQLAAVIAHEISHIQLRHTLQSSHHINMEYEADILSFYYLKRAGFGICGATRLWEKARAGHISLSPTSHPNYMTRAYYMNMPECKDKQQKEEVVTIQDAIDIFNRLNAHVAGMNRHYTRFEIFYFTNQANAYAGTRYKEVQR